MDTIRVNEVIADVLSTGCAAVGKTFGAEVISIFAPMTYGVDDLVRNEIENLVESAGEDRTGKLLVVLETTGGYVEVVERIVSVFRRHFDCVEFVVPNFAFSAGTILAMSGDEIYMDYYSVLGPIDPQFQNDAGQLLPGLGYLSKYNDLLDEINGADAGERQMRAQLAFLLKKFDPAQLFHIEQSIEHSKALINEWLPRYKFKGWTVTETSGTAVTDEMKKNRADQIATALGDASRWHSHGRGISLRELQGEDIGLRIVDYSDHGERSGNVRHYAGLLKDYMEKLGLKAAVHTKHRLSGL